MSNKKRKIFLVTYNQECKKKKIEGYMHFLVSMKHACRIKGPKSCIGSWALSEDVG